MSRRRLEWAQAALVFAWACNPPGGTAERRADLARGEGPLRIGVSYDHRAGARFGRAVEVARAQLGDRVGGIEIAVRDDQGQARRARENAQRFAEDLGVTAVIGHPAAPTADATAAMYEFHGLTFLTPARGPAEMSRAGFRHGFRVRPSAEGYGELLAEAAAARGWTRVLALFSNDDQGRALVNAFERRGERLNLRLVARVGHVPGALEATRFALQGGRELAHDAALVAATGALGEEMTQLLHDSGWRGPVLGVGGSAEGSTLADSHPRVLVALDPSTPDGAVREAARDFENAVGEVDVEVALAFDALWALVSAVERAGSRDPGAVSAALRGLEGVEGFTGALQFDARGRRMGGRLLANEVGADPEASTEP